MSDYDVWKLDGGWPYGDASAQEKLDEDLDAESQNSTYERNGTGRIE